MAIQLEGCPESCLPYGLTDAPRTPVPTRVIRGVRLAVHLGYGLLAVTVLLWLPRPAVHRFLKRWYKGVLRIAHVRLVVTGPRTTFAPPGRGTLVVANHTSWLDVVALNATQPLQLVSKAEVRRWPLIGRIAARTGTIFLDRTSYDDLRVVGKVVSLRLARGKVIGAFPEGTTTCGRGIGDLRPALFQAAVDAGAYVRPVALSCLDARGRLTTAGAFIGDMSLLASIRHVLRQDRLTLLVQIRPLVAGTGVGLVTDRRALAAVAADSIADALRAAVTATRTEPRSPTCRARAATDREELTVAHTVPRAEVNATPSHAICG